MNPGQRAMQRTNDAGIPLRVGTFGHYWTLQGREEIGYPVNGLSADGMYLGVVFRTAAAANEAIEAVVRRL